MKVLVSAASKYGATSEIAKAVGEVLAGKGLEVTVIPPQEVGAIEEFDAVVLGLLRPDALSDQRGSFAYHTDLESAQLMQLICPLIPSRPPRWAMSS